MRLWRAGIALWLCALAPAGVRAAWREDTECWRRESGRSPQPWIHDLPERDELPQPALIQRHGAFVILDEEWRIGAERVFTLIAAVESPAAIREFGALAFRTGRSEFAEIRARVRTPDGRVRELHRGEIHCSLDRIQNAGVNIGRSASPKRYTFTFPGVTPGSVVQYQVALRRHAGEPFDWLTRYAMLLPIQAGAQWRLIGAAGPGLDPRTRYPAGVVAEVFTVPASIDFAAVITPDDGGVLRFRQQSDDPFIREVVRFTAVRPPASEEPHAPAPELVSPWVRTSVSAIHRTSFSEEQYAPQSWDDWVFLVGEPPLIRAEADAGAPPAAPPGEGAPLQRARALCAFVRGRAPPEGLTRTEWLAGLLRATGHAAGLLYVRPAAAPAVDRGRAEHAFLGSLPPLAALLDGDTLRYFVAEGSEDCETLPSGLAGGEGILVEGRGRWRWVDLPRPDPDENGIRAEAELHPAGGMLYAGELRIEFRGAEAAALRRLRTLPAGARAAALTGVLSGFAGPRASISHAALEDPRPDDEGVVRARARLECAALAGSAGDEIEFPLRIGPRASAGGGTPRHAPVSFDPARRYVTRLRVPGGARPAAAPTALAAPGFAFTAREEPEAGGRLLVRELTLEGRHPPEAWPEIRAAFHAMESADHRPLALSGRP